jgi:crotonobetainyl-CoA:carnitine CoA-transferase CaiB-like acyl-CoA transferase
MCNKEKFWPVLCQAIGKQEWVQDPRFVSFKQRLENRTLIQDLLDAELSGKTTSEWLEIFAGAVPASPINDIAAALENPFVAERDCVQTLTLEGHGDYRMVASPVLSGGAQTPANPAPKLGQHTAEILTGIGYTAEQLDNLRKTKAI